MKIIVIDDEKNIRRIISDYLINEGYEVIEGINGLNGIEKIIKHRDIKLILLDIRMPKMDGYEAIIEIKKITDAPVIFLTALGEAYDEVRGLELGADDYIAKPFDYEVLIARVKACLRRNEDKKIKEISFGDLRIDVTNKEVYIKNRTVNLTIKEYELLEFLINNKNITLERALILDRVWGYDYYGDPRTVDTHIKTLRAKIGLYADMIKTIRGVGYKLETNTDKVY